MTFLKAAEPDLGPGESLAWRKACQLSLGSKSVGGSLFLTTRRLMFAPGPLTISGARDVRSYPLGDIASVDIQDRDYTPYKEACIGASDLRFRTET
jgi:hypothetical protein